MNAGEQILHLINDYCFKIDTGDIEGFAGLFEHGEWAVEGAAPIAGKQRHLEALSHLRIYADGTPRTRHVTSNVDLTIAEDGLSAKGQCYVTVFQRTDEFPLQVIFSGHYFDEFQCVGGAWRFRKRLIRYPLYGDMTAHLKVPPDILLNIR